MAIRAVAFDIDGTLYPSLGLYLRNLGFGIRHYEWLRAFAKVRAELHSRSVDPGSRASMTPDLAGFRALQARIMAARVGCTEAEAEAWAERVMYGELEDSFDRIRPFPGVEPALRRFTEAGLGLAALSDFPAPKKLEILGLDHYFKVALSSEETGFLKPAPEPFLMLAKRLGVAASDIVYVGNSPSLDIAGARAVGMTTALRQGSTFRGLTREPYVPQGFGSGTAPADLVFSDFSDLVAFVLGAEGSPRR